MPRQIDDGSGNDYFSQIIEEHNRQQYFEAVELAGNSIQDRFNQPGCAVYCNLEELLLREQLAVTSESC